MEDLSTFQASSAATAVCLFIARSSVNGSLKPLCLSLAQSFPPTCCADSPVRCSVQACVPPLCRHGWAALLGAGTGRELDVLVPRAARRAHARANFLPFAMLLLWSKRWSCYFPMAEALIIWSFNFIIPANTGIVWDPVNALRVCDCSKPHWNQQESFWTIELQTFLGVVYNATDLITMFLAGINMQMDFSAGGP